ncbi:glycine-rich domain-containing protein [Nocardiopsis mangrovi]|uniref:Glycine-rich domain-containing protein n=1 Tax=Nocardiopsis mangrovi TaxID=1179818 RepID=A0ABV9E4T9_9ACTN
MTTVQTATRGRDLIDHELFDRLAADVARDHGHRLDTAGRIVDQAVVYLVACSRTYEPIGPSPLVDHGWHAFILRTADYRSFCETVLGRFVDHYPNDTRPPATERARTAARTLDAVYATGLAVDADMWAQEVPCSSCTDTKDGGDGDGCHKGCHGSKSK